MNNKKSNGAITGLLIGIIIMLLVFVALFATNTISFNSKTNNNDKTTNTEENNDNEENNNTDEEKYSKIIEEYKNAINDNEYNNSTNTEEKYPNINDNMMHHYHADKSISFNYIYYDINKDGKNELIIGDGKDSIFEIYTYDGNKTNRFFNESCLGERCSTEIYSNGIIYFYGSGGANIHGLDFYKIANDGYSEDTIKSYEVEYDENKNITITDEITNTKTNYKSDEEVISNVVGNANKVDLSKLNWQEIK